VALVPLSVDTEIAYVEPTFIWLGAHVDNVLLVPPESTSLEKTTLKVGVMA
jgi:hypothetical protein